MKIAFHSHFGNKFLEESHPDLSLDLNQKKNYKTFFKRFLKVFLLKCMVRVYAVP